MYAVAPSWLPTSRASAWAGTIQHDGVAVDLDDPVLGSDALRDLVPVVVNALARIPDTGEYWSAGTTSSSPYPPAQAHMEHFAP
ncbi:hypothetical protein [Streptomyces sp. NBC_00878]|uniref:hypothetical protein n=1 Tax=Streptomyces sp. NBC_00878 TaxID=2975854 RepID=UPI002258B126|nr:hypothetical protein [Streptomyces sp. NBC_00878]